MPNMRPIGIVSIPRFQTPSPKLPFDLLMKGVGNNTGNLLFTNAVWHQLQEPKKHVGFNFNPEIVNATLRALVFPAANWLSPTVDFSELADRVEKLDIPVIMIGLGAQNDNYSSKVNIPEGTLRFVRAVSERCRSISVRGAYTEQLLRRLGITNVTITGCPSLYFDFQANAEKQLITTAQAENRPTLLHSTRYSAGYQPFIRKRSIHRDIFRYAFASETDLLLQSEPEEIGMIIEASDKPTLDKNMVLSMQKIYRANDWHDLEAFITRHTRVFFDTPSWTNAMTGYGKCFGTRLHATIMALNSGVPAILIPHDSRTREVAEFAGIPTTSSRGISLWAPSISALFAATDFSTYFTTRKRNMTTYFSFLADNGIEPAISMLA